MKPTEILRDAMRNSARGSYVSALQDGRIQRATRVPSGKTYKRTQKHRNQEEK